MGLLLTPTLLDAKDWLTDCPGSWKDRAYNSIKGTLSREPFVPTPAIKEGQRFEQFVFENCNKPDDQLTGSEHFQDVCRTVRGYGVGRKCNATVMVGGSEFYLFGRIDAFMPKGKSFRFPGGHVIDIKTTANYRSKDSYLAKWQHLFYCFMEKIPDFMYLIAEWVSKDVFEIKDVHKVTYHNEDMGDLHGKISKGVLDFVDFLDAHKELKELYFSTYQPKFRR